MWNILPEVFRIPKKERTEQIKEHERAVGMFFVFFGIYILIKFYRLELPNISGK